MKKIIAILLLAALSIGCLFADDYQRRTSHVYLEDTDEVITIDYVNKYMTEAEFDYWVDYTNIYEANRHYKYCNDPDNVDNISYWGFFKDNPNNVTKKHTGFECVCFPGKYMIIYMWSYND